jgi:TIR domain
MPQKTVFVSHIHEEAELAKLLKEFLGKSFLGMIKFFVTSDGDAAFGKGNWLSAVEENLRDCCMVIVLCSPESITRPWVNFEAGAAWISNIPVVPVCHSGLQPSNLPLPFAVLSAVTATDRGGIDLLLRRLAEALGSDVPKVDFDEIIDNIKKYQRESVGYVARLVSYFLSEVPHAFPLFAPDEPWKAVVQLDATAQREPRLILRQLYELGLIELVGEVPNSKNEEFPEDWTELALGYGGISVRAAIQMSEKYKKIADRVFTILNQS